MCVIEQQTEYAIDITPRGGESAKKRRLSDAEYVIIDQEQQDQQPSETTDQPCPSPCAAPDSPYMSDDDPFAVADVVASLPSSPTSPTCRRGVTIAKRRGRPARLRDEEHAVLAAAQGLRHEWASQTCTETKEPAGSRPLPASQPLSKAQCHSPCSAATSPRHDRHAQHERYVLCNQVGAGVYGEVWRALDNDTGEYVAVKMVLDEQECHEVAALEACVGHPHVLTLLDTYKHNTKQGGRMMLVTELADTDLLTRIQGGGPICEDQARCYAAALVSALSALHQVGYCHRDIKCENILLAPNGGLLLADFGSAEPLRRNGMPQSFWDVAGSPAYMPPEVVRIARGCASERYGGASADVWSAGVVLYAMVAGEFPFEMASSDCDRYQQFIHAENQWPPHFSEALIGLLRGMLAPASERFTMAEVEAHAWLNAK